MKDEITSKEQEMRSHIFDAQGKLAVLKTLFDGESIIELEQDVLMGIEDMIREVHGLVDSAVKAMPDPA